MSWTEEQIELLRKLWIEGASAKKIADQLGDKTKNAVIGKVHRLGLSAESRVTPMVAEPEETPALAEPILEDIETVDEPDALPQEPKPVEERPVPIPRRLVLDELSSSSCKWPSGDPLSEDFSFCGNEVEGKGPYCGYHSRLAYQPVHERKRAR